jgi:hypothetical protein
MADATTLPLDGERGAAPTAPSSDISHTRCEKSRAAAESGDVLAGMAASAGTAIGPEPQSDLPSRLTADTLGR